MADKIQTLLVSLEARINQYESTMKKAIATTNSTARRVETRVLSMNKVVSAGFSGLARGALTTIAPILGLAAAIDTVKAGLKEFGDIADNSKAAGLDSEFFQGLAYQASLGGVSVEQLSSSLSGFNRASGQAEAGIGRMATALAKLNPELLKNLKAAESQEERVRLAADAIAAAGSASEKAALSVALFGESGTKLADVFSGGAAAIDAAMRKAQDLGLVIDRDLIARADQLGDEFDTATKVLDLQFKAALVGLAPILTGTADLIGGVVMAVRGLIEQFSALDDRSTSSLEDRLQQIKELQATIGTDALSSQTPGAFGNNPMAVSIGGADTSKIEEEKKQIESILTLRKALEVPIVSGDSSGGYNAIAQESIDKAQAVLDSLKFEAEQLGRTSVEQEIYNNLKAAGVTAESAFGQQIAEATIKLEAQKTAIADNKEAMAEFGDLAKSATRGFIDDLVEGKSAAEAFGNVLGKIGDKLLDMGLTSVFGGGKNGSGLLGQVFGFASGTANTGGARGQVRGVVHGQEAVIPLPNGGNVPVDIKMPTPSGASSGITVSMPISIDASGADPAAIERLNQTVSTLKAEFPSRVVAAVRKAKSTGNLP